MQLTLLYRLTAKGTPEKLGQVPDGERLKVEFRGATAPGSTISGKVHGTDWVLVGPQGAGQVESLHEITGADRGRFVLQLRGSSTADGGVTRLKACGVVRSSGAFMHLDGHVAVAEGTMTGDDIDVAVYHF